MEFLGLWLGSSILSFCLEISNELRMFKDVADSGYKLNVEKFSEFVKQVNPDINKVTLLSLLIPIFNIMTVMQNRINYNNSRHLVIDQLYVLDVLDEMNSYEKNEYEKHKTGLNAILVLIKSEVKLKNAIKLELSDNSVVYFDKEENNFIIYKVEGPISRLSEEEQKQKIEEAYKKLVDRLLKKYENIDEFIEDISSNKDNVLDLSFTNIDNEESVDNSRETKIIKLKQLKDELLQENEEIANKSLRRERKK